MKALAELFTLLSELNVVLLIRRRLVELAARSGGPDSGNSAKLALNARSRRECAWQRTLAVYCLGLEPKCVRIEPQFSSEDLTRKPLFERAIAIDRESARSRAPRSREMAQQLRSAAARSSAFSLRDRASNHCCSLPARRGISRARGRSSNARIAITEKALGPEHPDLATSAQQLSSVAARPSAFSLRDRASTHCCSLPPAGGSRERKAALRTRDRYRRESARSRAPRRSRFGSTTWLCC